MGDLRIEIPDAILVWETEYEITTQEVPYLGTFVVRAVVGGVVVFERSYREYDYRTSEGVEDGDRAKDEAARELGEKLKALLA